jgi:hypothetical protein
MAEKSNRTGAVVALLAVVALIVIGFVYRDRLLARWAGSSEATAASPEVAAAAQAKLERLSVGGDSVRLSGVEITSLLRYRAPAAALEMVHDPSVEMAGDTLRLTGMIPTDRLPADPNLDKIRPLLPDTAKVVVRGTLEPRGPGETALRLQGVEFAGVPIPARYYGAILRKLGRDDEPGLDPAAVGLHLPDRVTGARISDGFLILTTRAH